MSSAPTGFVSSSHRAARAAASRATLLLAACAIASGLSAEPQTTSTENRPQTADAQSTSDASTGTESKQSKPVEEFSQQIVVTSTHPEFPLVDARTGDELEREGHDLGSFFRAQPGLAAVRKGPINLDPSIRGLQESQVAMFVDGTRTFAAGPARMDSDLSHVSPHAVSSAQFVKGPYALAWGSGALSAVALETHRPAFGSDSAGRLFLGYSDNGELFDPSLSLATTSARWRAQLTGGFRSGSEYDAGNGEQIPGDFESFDGRATFGAQLGQSYTLDYTGGYQDQSNVDYPGRLLDATFFKTQSHALELNGQPNASLGVELRLFSNHKDHLMNNDEKPTAQPNPLRIPPFPLSVLLPTNSDTEGAKFALRHAAGDWRWTFGADYYQLEQSANRTVSRRDTGMVVFQDNVWPDATTENVGGYVQAVRQLNRATLAATVRLDSFDIDAERASQFFLDNTDGALSSSEDTFSAAVSTAIQAGSNGRFSIGLGRATRPASTLERYSDRFPSTKFQIAAEFMGDPTLDSETSTEFDLGYSWRNASTSFGVEGFVRVIDDYITVVPDGSLPKRLPLSPDTVFRYIQGDEADFRGLEARVQHEIAGSWQLLATASWIDGEDAAFDEPVFGLDPLNATVIARRLLGRGWLEAAAHWSDDQTDVATARFERETDGYTRIDLGAGIEFGERWKLRAELFNATDEDYAEHLNTLNPFSGARIPEPGRTLRLVVDLEL